MVTTFRFTISLSWFGSDLGFDLGWSAAFIFSFLFGRHMPESLDSLNERLFFPGLSFKFIYLKKFYEKEEQNFFFIKSKIFK